MWVEVDAVENDIFRGQYLVDVCRRVLLKYADSEFEEHRAMFISALLAVGEVGFVNRAIEGSSRLLGISRKSPIC